MSSDVRRRGIWWDDGKFCFYSGDFSREEAENAIVLLVKKPMPGEAFLTTINLNVQQEVVVYVFKHTNRIYIYSNQAREKSAA